MECPGELSRNVTCVDDCFKAFVDGVPVELGEQECLNIITKLLKMNLTSSNLKLKAILPYMFIHYVKTWPGWQKTSKYRSSQLTYDKWLGSFKTYLIYKLNYLINHDFKKALDLLEKEKEPTTLENKVVEKRDQETQYLCKDISEAPFTLKISGPSKYVNTLLFCDSGNDVVIRNYHCPVWKNLNFIQLLNWPGVQVKFSSSELTIVRKNKHKFLRHIINPKAKRGCPPQEYLEDVNPIEEGKEMVPYSVKLMRTYCEKYIRLFRCYEEKNFQNVVNEIELFFKQFIQDIDEVNINQSIAANSYVLFNIGHCLYNRNKKLASDITSGIVLNEHIVPMVEISLVDFKGVTFNSENSGSFKVLDSIKDKVSLKSVFPTLEYTCLMCKFVVQGESCDMLHHLYNNHVMEQPVICYKCWRQYDVCDLALNRWTHLCVKNL